MLIGVIGVGVMFRISFSVVNYSYVSFSGLMTSVGEERADFSAIDFISFRIYGRVSFPFLCLV